ncbi:MAG: hypothetical protein F4X12_18315 [Acidobacteriia bacterium]|nr:hypothetical protein [Terriglobia bacterium]
MTSDVAFPDRFTEIDELTRPDHYRLTDDDRCYFLGEYTAGKGYSYSQTNQLILNFKKSLDRQDKPEWQYKQSALLQAAASFRRALGEDPTAHVFVPMPPSKARDNPLHDDRVKRMLLAIWPGQSADIRELIVQSESADAAHERRVRPTPEELQAAYRIDKSLATPEPRMVAIVDDLLTTGAHFRAASSVLAAHFPAVQIIGLFLARRVPDAESLH